MKEIKDFPGYFVTEEGKVFSYWNKRRALNLNKKPRELKQRAVNGGYFQVALFKDGIRTFHLVHRLVAKSFIPNPNNLETVNHINEDKTDNTVKNLEWMTLSDNIKYSHSSYFKLKSPKGEIVEGKNLAQFCRDNNLLRSGFSNIKSGKAKHHKGWSVVIL
jgi:hypothetical protein